MRAEDFPLPASRPATMSFPRCGSDLGPEGDVCVLLNGMTGERVPLSWFSADQVERVEVIAADNDWTGSIGDRMGLVKGCERDGIHHPPYFVVWMRGAS